MEWDNVPGGQVEGGSPAGKKEGLFDVEDLINMRDRSKSAGGDDSKSSKSTPEFGKDSERFRSGKGKRSGFTAEVAATSSDAKTKQEEEKKPAKAGAGSSNKLPIIEEKPRPSPALMQYTTPTKEPSPPPPPPPPSKPQTKQENPKESPKKEQMHMMIFPEPPAPAPALIPKPPAPVPPSEIKKKQEDTDSVASSKGNQKRKAKHGAAKEESKKLFLRSYTREDVAKHNTKASAWTIYNNLVIDITKWMKVHPGGQKILEKYMGKDCTEDFRKQHHWINPLGFVGDAHIGYLKGK